MPAWLIGLPFPQSSLSGPNIYRYQRRTLSYLKQLTKSCLPLTRNCFILYRKNSLVPKVWSLPVQTNSTHSTSLHWLCQCPVTILRHLQQESLWKFPLVFPPAQLIYSIVNIPITRSKAMVHKLLLSCSKSAMPSFSVIDEKSLCLNGKRDRFPGHLTKEHTTGPQNIEALLMWECLVGRLSKLHSCQNAWFCLILLIVFITNTRGVEGGNLGRAL